MTVTPSNDLNYGQSAKLCLQHGQENGSFTGPVVAEVQGQAQLCDYCKYMFLLILISTPMILSSLHSLQKVNWLSRVATELGTVSNNNLRHY